MQTLQQTAPISDMRKDQESVLSMMENGPVLLMARSRPKAVIVDPGEWNRIAQRLQFLEQERRSRIAAQKLEELRNSDLPIYTKEELGALLDADSA